MQKFFKNAVSKHRKTTLKDEYTTLIHSFSSSDIRDDSDQPTRIKLNRKTKDTVIISVPILCRVKAMYRFHPDDLENNEETNIAYLRFEGEEIIDVIDQDGPWWEGIIQGNLGVFPSTYVSILETYEDGSMFKSAFLKLDDERLIMNGAPLKVKKKRRRNKLETPAMSASGSELHLNLEKNTRLRSSTIDSPRSPTGSDGEYLSPHHLAFLKSPKVEIEAQTATTSETNTETNSSNNNNENSEASNDNSNEDESGNTSSQISEKTENDSSSKAYDSHLDTESVSDLIYELFEEDFRDNLGSQEGSSRSHSITEEPTEKDALEKDEYEDDEFAISIEVSELQFHNNLLKLKVSELTNELEQLRQDFLNLQNSSPSSSKVESEKSGMSEEEITLLRNKIERLEIENQTKSKILGDSQNLSQTFIEQIGKLQSLLENERDHRIELERKYNLLLKSLPASDDKHHPVHNSSNNSNSSNASGKNTVLTKSDEINLDHAKKALAPATGLQKKKVVNMPTSFSSSISPPTN